jgi:hypothetical protein
MNQSKRFLDELDLGDKDELVVSVKISAQSRFFYGDPARLREMADQHRGGEAASQLEYQEHEAGPEWSFRLTLVDGGIGIAEASVGTVISIAEMVAHAVQADWEGRRAHCAPPESLIIVVWGYDPKGVFAESPDLEITLHGDSPPEEKKTGDIVTAAIHTAAEVRRLQEDADLEEESQREEESE